MRKRTLKARKGLAMLVLAIGSLTSPVVGQSVAECYAEVLERCDEALEESAWWEKPAVGLICTGMLAGCGFEAL